MVFTCNNTFLLRLWKCLHSAEHLWSRLHALQTQILTHWMKLSQDAVLWANLFRGIQLLVWLQPWWLWLFEGCVYCITHKNMTRTNKFLNRIWFHSSLILLSETRASLLGNPLPLNKTITRRVCSTCGWEREVDWKLEDKSNVLMKFDFQD